MGQPNTFSQVFAAANSTAIATSQSPGAGLITITTTAGVSLDAARRVLITSGGNDTGINFTVIGTNQFGYPITDTFAGANGTSQSNLDFKTVTGITHTGSVASTLTAGTGNTGSSSWQIINWNSVPNNLSIAVELRSGAATFTIEHTYDDPNILPMTGGLNAAGLGYPFPWPDPTINGASGSAETSYQIPIIAWRLTTVSGTGTLVVRALQSGLGSP